LLRIYDKNHRTGPTSSPKADFLAQIRHSVLDNGQTRRLVFTNGTAKIAIFAQTPRSFCQAFGAKIVPTQNQRDADRHSLFLTAQCDLPQSRQQGRVRVRNVSAQGLMAEGLIRPDVGEPVVLMLRNIGRVEGMVAWARGDRFGVALASDIEAQAVLAREEAAPQDRDYYQRGPLATLRREGEKIRPI
jgi:hypothetical protein